MNISYHCPTGVYSLRWPQEKRLGRICLTARESGSFPLIFVTMGSDPSGRYHNDYYRGIPGEGRERDLRGLYSNSNTSESVTIFAAMLQLYETAVIFRPNRPKRDMLRGNV